MDEFFWGFNEYEKVRAAQNEASKATSKANDANAQLRTLTSQVDRLTLACQAMWEILRDQTNITEEDLTDKISEIDLRDGVADGKMGAQVVECPKCHRNSNSRRHSCVWCGAEIERKHVFEG